MADLADAPRTCPTCGTTLATYRHSLNVALVRGLIKLHEAGGGPINLRHLDLTRNQWDNFQKLRYFGLVAQVFEDGKRRRGVWEITELGRDFLRGAATVRRISLTYKGETIGADGEEIHPSDVIEGYVHRERWAAAASGPPQEGEQSELFR